MSQRRKTPLPFTKYLIKKGTDELFAYCFGIAERLDFENYYGPDPTPVCRPARLTDPETTPIKNGNFNVEPLPAEAKIEAGKLTSVQINALILELRAQGKSFAAIGKVLGISKVAIFRRFRRIERSNPLPPVNLVNREK